MDTFHAGCVRHSCMVVVNLSVGSSYRAARGDLDSASAR